MTQALGLIYPAVVAGLNLLLEQQKSLQKLLLPHVGKCVAFEWTVTAFYLKLRVGNRGRFELESPSSNSETDVNLVFNGGVPMPPMAMEQILSHLRIEGNAEFAEVLSRLIQSLEFRPGDWLQPIVGDILSYRLERFAQALGTEASRLLPGILAKSCFFSRGKTEVLP